jgi:hypothetical protein
MEFYVANEFRRISENQLKLPTASVPKFKQNSLLSSEVKALFLWKNQLFEAINVAELGIPSNLIDRASI